MLVDPGVERRHLVHRSVPVVVDELVHHEVQGHRRRRLGQALRHELIHGRGVDAEQWRCAKVEAPRAHDADEVIEEPRHAERVEHHVRVVDARQPVLPHVRATVGNFDRFVAPVCWERARDHKERVAHREGPQGHVQHEALGGRILEEEVGGWEWCTQEVRQISCIPIELCRVCEKRLQGQRCRTCHPRECDWTVAQVAWLPSFTRQRHGRSARVVRLTRHDAASARAACHRCPRRHI